MQIRTHQLYAGLEQYINELFFLLAWIQRALKSAKEVG